MSDECVGDFTLAHNISITLYASSSDSHRMGMFLSNVLMMTVELSQRIPVIRDTGTRISPYTMDMIGDVNFDLVTMMFTFNQ